MATHAPPVELFYDPADLDPAAPRPSAPEQACGCCWPVTLQAAMAAGAQQLTFDPADVDPGAPKLHVRREADEWEVRSAAGVLSTHATQEEALAAARSRVPECGAEVFFESRSGRFLHRVARSPAELRFLELWQNIYDDHHALPDQAAG